MSDPAPEMGQKASSSPKLKSADIWDGCVETPRPLQPGQTRVLSQTLSPFLAKIYQQEQAQPGAHTGIQILNTSLLTDPKRVIRGVKDLLAHRNASDAALEKVLANPPEDVPVHKDVEGFVIAQDDPRIALRGQQGARWRPSMPQRVIPACTVIGFYRALQVAETEAVSEITQLIKYGCPPDWPNRYKWAQRVDAYSVDLDLFWPASFQGSSFKIQAVGAGYGNITGRINDAATPNSNGSMLPYNKSHNMSRSNVTVVPVVIGHWAFPVVVTITDMRPGSELLYAYDAGYWRIHEDNQHDIGVWEAQLERGRQLTAELAACKAQLLLLQAQVVRSSSLPDGIAEQVHSTDQADLQGRRGQPDVNLAAPLGKRSKPSEEATEGSVSHATCLPPAARNKPVLRPGEERLARSVVEQAPLHTVQPAGTHDRVQDAVPASSRQQPMVNGSDHQAYDQKLTKVEPMQRRVRQLCRKRTFQALGMAGHPSGPTLHHARCNEAPSVIAPLPSSSVHQQAAMPQQLGVGAPAGNPLIVSPASSGHILPVSSGEIQQPSVQAPDAKNDVEVIDLCEVGIFNGVRSQAAMPPSTCNANDVIILD